MTTSLQSLAVAAGRRPWRFQIQLDTGRLTRAAAGIWMNLLVGAVLVAPFVVGVPITGVATPDGPSWSLRAVSLFAVWLLSFVPGWLYLRFLCLRADALWHEYVLNLYRLGVDEPAFLPPPLPESAYAGLPGASAGGDEKANIYRQKFDAYYGPKVSARSGDGADRRVTIESLFPVFLCTVTLTVAWTLILWDPVVLLTPREPWATLEFGFLGAYTFALSMLVRRFYQSDLRPSAYAAVVLRIVVVLLTLAVLHQAFTVHGPGGDLAHATQYVAAFVVGFFPLAGLQALNRIAAKVLRVVVPQVVSEYPLEQLDGLNIWYEARLAEEGVEDMQNLVTMNLVDVILHTRAPVGRLVDWVDQAFLLVHLDPVARGRNAAPADGTVSTRLALRRVGIRTATDLLRAFDVGPGADGRQAWPADAFRARGLDPDQLATVCRLLASEPGLNPVWNWKSGEVARTVVRR